MISLEFKSFKRDPKEIFHLYDKVIITFGSPVWFFPAMDGNPKDIRPDLVGQHAVVTTVDGDNYGLTLSDGPRQLWFSGWQLKPAPPSLWDRIKWWFQRFFKKEGA